MVVAVMVEENAQIGHYCGLIFPSSVGGRFVLVSLFPSLMLVDELRDVKKTETKKNRYNYLNNHGVEISNVTNNPQK